MNAALRVPTEDDVPQVVRMMSEHSPDPADEDRRPWRGLGLGRALLHAFHEFRRRGLRRAGLGVDSESPTGANRLYESVGMREVARFEIRERAVA